MLLTLRLLFNLKYETFETILELCLIPDFSLKHLYVNNK